MAPTEDSPTEEVYPFQIKCYEHTELMSKISYAVILALLAAYRFSVSPASIEKIN